MVTGSKRLISTILASLMLALAACGGGGTNSGGAVAIAPAAAPPPPPAPTTMPGVIALHCLSNIQVRRNNTALVLNICTFTINVRNLGSRFGPGPITEIEPAQTVAVELNDELISGGLAACRSPSIPRMAPDDPDKFFCTDVPI